MEAGGFSGRVWCWLASEPTRGEEDGERAWLPKPHGRLSKLWYLFGSLS